MLPVVGEGSLPSVVKRMVAPGVEVVMVTGKGTAVMVVSGKTPRRGEKTVSATLPRLLGMSLMPPGVGRL